MKKIYINDSFDLVNNEIVERMIREVGSNKGIYLHGSVSKKRNYKSIASDMKEKQSKEYQQLAFNISEVYKQAIKTNYKDKYPFFIDLNMGFIQAMSSFQILNIELIDSYKSSLQIDLTEAIKNFTDDKELQNEILKKASEMAIDTYIKEKGDTVRYYNDVMTNFVYHRNKMKGQLRENSSDDQPGN